MSNTKIGYENGGVIYIEPNYTSSEIAVRKSAKDNAWIVDDRKMYAPNLEDYCIAVNLTVSVPERSANGEVTNSEGTYIMSWDGDKATVSFFSGSEYNGGRYFTTAPYETTTFVDVLNAPNVQTTTENFGINSIDIEYNNYAVPQVTIEFTDIRGLSLFMPEEVRHSKNQGGISSSADADISGSFFKCFFMFPYPKFQLTVKGFYGEPVSYELTCSDFRAKFDCTNGSFNATCKLIGYAFSILNDVSLNHLVAAPHETTIGAKYWDEQVSNGTFTFDDDSHGAIPKLTEVVQKVNTIRGALESLKATDPTYQEAEDVEAQQTENEGAHNELQDLLTYVKDNIGTVKGKQVYNTDGQVAYVIERDTNIKEAENANGPYKTFNDNFNEKAKKVNETCSDIGQIYFCEDPFTLDSLNYGPDGLPNLSDSIKNKFLDVDKNTKKQILASANDSNDTKAYLTINYKALKDQLNNQTTKLKDKEEAVTNEIKAKEESVVASALGFRPTVENCTKILMAHFETLIDCIYETAVKAGSVSPPRTLSDLGIDSTDLAHIEGGVPPYPRVDTVVTDANGIQTKEDGWLGNLTTADKAPEVALVEGFIEATKEVAEAFNTLGDDTDPSGGSDEDYSGITEASSTKYFGGLSDLINDSTWVGEVNTANFAEVVAVATLRCFTTIGMNSDADSTYTDDTGTNSWKYFAKQDAREFAKCVNNVDSNFKSKLSNTDSFSKDNLLKCIEGTSTDLLVDNKMPWGQNKLVSKSSYYYLNAGKVHKKINGIVTDAMQTEKIGSTYVSNGASATYKGFNSYIGKTSIVNFPESSWNTLNCEGLLRIDTNYEKYLKIYNAFDNTDGSARDITQLLEPFDNIDDYGKYYDNTAVMFSVDKEGKDPTPDYKEVNKVLPRIKPNDFTSSAFKGEDIIDSNYDDFDTVNYYTRNKDDVAEGYVGNKKDEFRICKLSGLEGEKFSNEGCLFGSPAYYACGNNYGKAFMFLATIDKPSYFEKVVKMFTSNDDDDLCGFIPYYMILEMGGYCYIHRHGVTQIFGNGTTFANFFTKSISKVASPLDDLRIDFQAKLINEFKAFADGAASCPYSFKKIKTALEMKAPNGTPLYYSVVKSMCQHFSNAMNNDKTYDDFLKYHGGKWKTMEEYIAKCFSNEFCESYFSMGYEEGTNSIQLYIRPNSTIGNYVYNLIFQPCAVIKGTTYLSGHGGYAKVEPTALGEYLEAFFEQLKEIYGNAAESSDSGTTDDTGITTLTGEGDVNIRKGIYKYHKILYDNWISGNGKDFWNLENFYKPNWHFIDSFYNRIGQQIIIDITEFCDDIIYSQSEEGYSLLSFISKTFAKSRFSLQTVQNFLDLMDKSKFERMFDPIPYEKVNWGAVKKHPDFILLYTYEPSSKLNLGDDCAYSGDSFNICDEQDLPTAISMKELTEGGYRIPAFGVTYGMQYQSYFKNIDVSMESPVVTEQSLRAQYMLSSAAVGKNPDGTNDTGENGNHIHFLGQDLFTIYANNSYTCNVTMMGCAWIQPLLYFQLNNVPLFRGAYLIQKVSHHIEPGNMETKFTGTRMAKQQTSKVNSNILLGNGSTLFNGNSPYEVESGTQAKLENNCDYKYFSPNGGDGPSVDVTQKAKNLFHGLPSAYDNSTMAEVLAATAYGAVGNTDLLAAKLVMVCYYNRYQQKGWGGIFSPGVTEYNISSAMGCIDSHPSNWNKLVQAATDIFKKSPSVIVGEKTTVYHSIPIYVNGKKTSQKTCASSITLDNVQRMYYYCSPVTASIHGKIIKVEGGEYSSYAASQNKNCKQFIADSVYVCQHEWPKGLYGHVMLGSIKSGTFWKAVPKSNNKKDTKNPSTRITNIVECIKQTLQYSEKVKIDTSKIKVNKGTTQGKSADSVYLTSSEKGAIPQIFDAILQAYYPNDVKEVGWLFKNDSSEDASKIYINCQEKATPQVYIKRDGDSKQANFQAPSYSGVNEKLKLSLKKKFGPTISSSNVKDFKSQVRAFVASGKESDFIKNINANVFNATLEECQLTVGGGGSYDMNSGYVNSAVKASLKGNVEGEYHLILHRYSHGNTTYKGKGASGVAYNGVIYEAASKKVVCYTIESQRHVKRNNNKPGIYTLHLHSGGSWEKSARHRAQANVAFHCYEKAEMVELQHGCLFHMGAGVNDGAGDSAWTKGCILIGNKPINGRNDRQDFPFSDYNKDSCYSNPKNPNAQFFCNFYSKIGKHIHEKIKLEIVENWSGSPTVMQGSGGDEPASIKT